MRQAFTDLGISMGDLKTMNIEDVIKKTSDAFKGGIPSQRAGAAALQLFGRNYKALLPMLRAGREGIDKNKKLIEQYGAYLGTKGLSDVGKYKQAQREMKIAFDAIKIAIGTKVLPEIIKLAPKVGELAQGFIAGKGKYAEFADNMKSIGGTIADMAGAFVELISTKDGAVLTIAAIGTAMAIAAPQITAAGAAVMALVAAYKFLDKRRRDQQDKDNRNAGRIADDPTGIRGQGSKVSGASGATRRNLTDPNSANPFLGSALGQVTRGLAKRFGSKSQYQMSVAVRTENAQTQLRLLDAAAKSKLSKPKILKILGDKKPADQKLRELAGQKVNPKTQKVKGDTRDAHAKVDGVNRRKVEPKNFVVRAIDRASGVLDGIISRLGRMASGAAGLPKKLWNQLFGRSGGRMENLPRMAGGGRIPGRPEPRDSALAFLSPGEFVVTRDGENRLERMTFPGVLNWLEGAQAPHFATGGRATPRRLRVPGSFNRWRGFLDDRERTYSQNSRDYELSGGGTDAKEYDRLWDFKWQSLDALKRMISATPGHLGKASRRLAAARRRGKKGEADAQRYKEYVETLRAFRHDLPFERRDLELDLRELENNRAAISRDSISQKAQEWSDFQTSRANALASFGSNFIGAGASMTGAAGLAGYRYYGAGASNGSVGSSGRTVSIVNNFQQGPTDPHTWSRGVHYELGALV
jgi:hypothetical protein